MRNGGVLVSDEQGQVPNAMPTQVMVEPDQLMETLARSRPLFHSEADFQHTFAWELHRVNSDWDIRLEVPVRTIAGAIHLDVRASSQSAQVAIELKYKTRGLATSVNGEDFALANQAAQDLGRYDFFKDLSRVEAFAQGNADRTGCAIFLTNDSAYWKAPTSSSHGYADFAMNDGRGVSGTLSWGDRASLGTRRGREDSIAIHGHYLLRWMPYSSVVAKSYGEFRYLCVQTGSHKSAQAGRN